MTFTTLTFVLFLAVVFALYWSMRGRGAQNALMVVASYCFYGWWDWRFCGLLLFSSLVDFGVGRGLDRATGRATRRGLLLVSILANLGVLGFFKYFNFFAENFQVVCETLGWHADPVTLRIILPVGISFYTFQTMSYTIDVYRGRLRATGNLVAYLAYVSSFPQLVAGPIERGARYLPQFLRARRFDYDEAAGGCRQILWGFFKKMVVADGLGIVVDDVYARLGSASGPEIAYATVCFAFQIYGDFSGYSDIAIGTGRLFGLKLMRNFAYPYFSQSLGEFWRRWHISLSTWFRDYVYIPLGGSRGGAARVAFNVMVTFVVSGLWHGASWNFVIWGAIMGLGVLPEVLRNGGPRLGPGDTPGGDALVAPAGVVMRIAATFALACLGWIFFRAATLPEAWHALQRLFADVPSPEGYRALGALFDDKPARVAPALVTALVVTEWVQRRHPHPLMLDDLPRWARWAAYTALLWLIVLVGPKEHSQFIYFAF